MPRGPRHGRTHHGDRSLSASRLRLLELLQAQPEATTIAALVSATGLHPNTVREHLDGLERAGLVNRRPAPAQGRGRPAWLYDVGRPGAGGAGDGYAGLASVLAATIHRTSARPSEEARRAGRGWGRDLARAHGMPGDSSAATARGEVAALLEEVGFAPVANGRRTTIRLTRCPLLEAARRHPDIVCAVHLGMVEGALEEFGTHSAGTELTPFAEPGACLLRLSTRAPRG